MSVFTESLNQSFKNKKINSLSHEDKKKYQLDTLNNYFNEFMNKENRYIFYCPDIIVVNHFVKTIYDFAYTLHGLGYNVTILHEIKGYKPHWLYNNESTKGYKDLKIDYVIEKRSGKKTKKEKNTYDFKPTDTIIILDMFQEILENIYNTRLIQKVVLVTGYAGIGNLPTGYSYKSMGVNTLLYLNEQIKKDYESVFIDVDHHFLIDKFIVDNTIFDSKEINVKTTYPVICLSKIGNEKLAQQVTNIFYNKYPNFRVFSFKIIDREDYSVYFESLKHSCLYLNLDESLHKQSLLEPISLGIPTATYERKELESDSILSENVIVAKRDAFSIVEFLVMFCTDWLQSSTNFYNAEILKIAKKVNIEENTLNNFATSASQIVNHLQEERVKFFLGIKQSVEVNEVNESKAGV